MKDNALKQAWLVLGLSALFGGALAGVQVAWGPKIERNRENDARRQVPVLVPGAVAELTGDGEDLLIDDAAGRRVYRFYRAMAPDASGQATQIGWVVKAKGPGYADNIELLVGLDTRAERITGMYVLAQNETPGLGNKIRAAKWRGQFTGKAAASPLTVCKAGAAASDHDIETVSGATISSQSVCDIVNLAVADFRRKLDELKGRE